MELLKITKKPPSLDSSSSGSLDDFLDDDNLRSNAALALTVMASPKKIGFSDLVSPLRSVTFASTVSMQSPEDSGMFSPSFVLSSPMEMPRSATCGSAVITPSIFDTNKSENKTNLLHSISYEVENDFFDTFQVSNVTSTISALISLKTYAAEDRDDFEEMKNDDVIDEDDDDDDDDEDYEDKKNPVSLAKQDNIFISAPIKEEQQKKSTPKSKRSHTNKNFTTPSPTGVTSAPKSATKSKKPIGPPADELIQCKCKKSQCLKLYCDCFASSKYCHVGCVCMDCLNSKDSESFRQDAIRQISERKPALFNQAHPPKAAACLSGCHCKKSRCLKKYCVCYENKSACSEACKCVSCLNLTSRKDSSFSDDSFDCGAGSSIGAVEQLTAISKAKAEVAMSRTRKVRFASLNDSQEIVRDVDTGAGAEDSMSLITPEPKPSKSEVKIQQPSKFEAKMQQVRASLPRAKKRKLEQLQQPTQVVYPFFGNVQIPKLTTLKIFEYLDNKDLFHVSLVNSLLHSAAMDEALWEDSR